MIDPLGTVHNPFAELAVLVAIPLALVGGLVGLGVRSVRNWIVGKISRKLLKEMEPMSALREEPHPQKLP